MRVSPLARDLGRARLEVVLDHWAGRALAASRSGDPYKPGQTNWARRPVRVSLAPRFRPDKR